MAKKYFRKVGLFNTNHTTTRKNYTFQYNIPHQFNL